MDRDEFAKLLMKYGARSARSALGYEDGYAALACKEDIQEEYDHVLSEINRLSDQLAAKDAEIAALTAKNARLTELTRMHAPEEIPPMNDAIESIVVDVSLNGSITDGHYSTHLSRNGWRASDSDGDYWDAKIDGWYYKHGTKLDEVKNESK